MKTGDAGFYVVVGGGVFPWDMLRYDRAFPALESEISRVGAGLDAPVRFVTLGITARERGPLKINRDRWKSFGWVPVDCFGGPFTCATEAAHSVRDRAPVQTFEWERGVR